MGGGWGWGECICLYACGHIEYLRGLNIALQNFTVAESHPTDRDLFV